MKMFVFTVDEIIYKCISFCDTLRTSESKDFFKS